MPLAFTQEDFLVTLCVRSTRKETVLIVYNEKAVIRNLFITAVSL